MLKVDYFSIKWNLLLKLEDYLFNNQTSYNMEILNNITSLKLSGMPIDLYNPILIKAPTSAGKTHLLDSLALTFHKQAPNFKIAYGKAHGLINIFNDKKNQARRIEELYEADILLLDDIHLLVGRPDIQKELVLLIDNLIGNNKLVAVTYSIDKNLEQSSFFSFSWTLEDALLSRLSSGIVFNLENPDLDVRMRVVEKLSEDYKLNLTKAMCLSVARFSQDIRQLKGVLKTIAAYTKATKISIDEEDLLRMLNGYGDSNSLSPELIIAHTATYFGLQTKELKGTSRKKNIIMARQVGMYLCRKLLGLSFSRIADLFGGKDHTTVIHACRKVEDQPALQPTLELLTEKINYNSTLLTGF